MDATGARRFWPVPVIRIDLDAASRDRDQLWAEAWARVSRGEIWWPTHELESLGVCVQEDRFEGNPWEAPIGQWIEKPIAFRIEENGRRFEDPLDPTGGLSMDQFLRYAVGVDMNRQNKAEQGRVATILRRFGWTRDENARHVKGERVRLWRPPASTPAQPPAEAPIDVVSEGGAS